MTEDHLVTIIVVVTVALIFYVLGKVSGAI